MTNKKITFFFLLPVLLSFILHLHILKSDVIGYHVWRQSQTQTVIYHFTFTDPNIFHPKKFDLGNGGSSLMYEFPLYQWLIAQVNILTGYSVLNSRVMTFVFFIGILLGFYRLQRRYVTVEIALLANCLLCFSPLLYFYCVNPLPDILALCFATWSLYFFFTFLSSEKWKHFLSFALFLLLATLVKLPFIIFGSVFIFYAGKKLRHHRFTQVIAQSFVLLLTLLPAVIWYSLAIPTWRDKGTLLGMTSHNKSFMHLLDCFQFNLFSSVPELITNYASCIFLLTGIFLFIKRFKVVKKTHTYLIVLSMAVAAYFFYELNMIEKTHDYYLLPFVPLIFLLVTYGLKHYYTRHRKFVFFVACLVPLTAWLRIDQRWDRLNPGFVSDYLDEQTQLQSIIPVDQKCIIDHDDSHFTALYYLKRYGYSLYDKELTPAGLKARYMDGASYFVTDNLSINLAEYRDLNFRLLYDKNLKVYKLSLK